MPKPSARSTSSTYRASRSVSDPQMLRRSDGVSVYRHTGADHYTSQRLLDVEQQIVEAAGRTTATAPDPHDVKLALMAASLDRPVLNDGQRELVRALLSDPRQVALALAPVGAGKTTAMSVLAQVCQDLGYNPVGLAPAATAATAAAVLGEATGMQSDALAMLDHTLAAGVDPGLPGATTAGSASAAPTEGQERRPLDRERPQPQRLASRIPTGSEGWLPSGGASTLRRHVGRPPTRRQVSNS